MFEDVRNVEATDPAVLASALFALSDEQIEGMSQAQAEALAVASQRVVSAVTARQRSAMETVARRCDEQSERDAAEGVAAGMRPHYVSGHAVAAGSLAALLHVSPRTMSTRINHARRVVCSLPEIQALAWNGDLEPYRVDAVVTESLAAPTDRLHEFEARVLAGDATQLSCAALRRRARRSAERCNPQEAAQAAELARAQRDVSIRPGECAGMTRLVADLPTPTALRLWSAVDGLAAEYARAQPGLRMGAARADALSGLIEANATISTTVELVAPIDCERSGSVAPPVSTACLGMRDDATDLASDRHGSAMTDSTDADAAPELTAVPGWYADLGGCEELDDGLLHDHGGDLWFVSSHTEVPVLGSLLPADVVALLSDPDVVVRQARSDSVTGAVRWQDPNHLPTRCRYGPRRPLAGRDLPVPGVCHRREAVPARSRHPSPRRPRLRHQPAVTLCHPPRVQAPCRLAGRDGPARRLHLDRARRAHRHDLAVGSPRLPRGLSRGAGRVADWVRDPPGSP